MENNERGSTLIVLVGATASGKTATSLAFAELLRAKRAQKIEIISADSRQIYRHLTIGTAKPTPGMLASVEHHFVDIKNPDESYSAGMFGADAERAAQAIFARGNTPLVVGGSGLYVKALCDGLFEDAADTSAEREILERRLLDEGIAALYKELQTVDAVLAEKYNDLNPRRVIRALEYYRTTGIPLSEAHKTYRLERPFRARYFGVQVERDELYARINRRAEEMFAHGLLEETEAVLSMGYSPNLNALNTVGYKEAMACLRGKISRSKAVELTQQNTRRYAKRQRTWFKSEERIEWISGSPENVAERMFTALGL